MQEVNVTFKMSIDMSLDKQQIRSKLIDLIVPNEVIDDIQVIEINEEAQIAGHVPTIEEALNWMLNNVEVIISGTEKEKYKGVQSLLNDNFIIIGINKDTSVKIKSVSSNQIYNYIDLMNIIKV